MKTKQLDLLKKIVNNLENGTDSLKMSLNNVHAKGMFSLVVDGSEPGQLTRIFMASHKLRPYEVQLHTHRYPVRLTALRGTMVQFTAEREPEGYQNTVVIPCYKYRSFLNGGDGLSYMFDGTYSIKDFAIPIGSTIAMTSHDFHTMSCSKDAVWVVEELGFQEEESYVLGVPFQTQDLYTKPEMFQVNDKAQIALTILRKLVSDYESI